MSVTLLKRKLKDGYEIHYWDSQNINAKKVLINFSGGYENGSEVKLFENFLPDSIRVLSPCYPGRGGSHIWPKFDSFSELALIIVRWITEMKLDETELYYLGGSFGTAVVNEILRLGKTKPKGVVLIMPGEFFKPGLFKTTLKKIFSYALNKRRMRRALQLLLTKVIPSHFDNERFLSNNTKSLDEQWIASLDYSIDTSKVSDVKTLIVVATKDNIIDNKSLNKILTIYPNHKIEKIEHAHIVDIYKEAASLDEILKQNVIPFVNSKE